jgi:hypothetical protein
LERRTDVKGRMFYRCPERGVIKSHEVREFEDKENFRGACPHCKGQHPFFVLVEFPKAPKVKEAAQ